MYTEYMHTMSYMHKLYCNGCRVVGYDSEYIGTCHRLYSHSISVADVAPQSSTSAASVPPASVALAAVTTSASASLFSPSLIPHLMLYVASIELQVAVLFVAVASCAF